MTATMSAYYNELIEFFKPSAEIESSRSRRSTIETRLDDDHVVSMFETGSLRHGTAIWLYSDVDFFVRFYDTRPTPDTALDRIKRSMTAIYPNTSIRISKPAVKLAFTSGVDVELVPAYEAAESDTYWIPDPKGGWMKSSPALHNKYVNQANTKHSQVKMTIRLLKIWKARKSVPISSFYLEMLVARYAIAEPEFSPTVALYAALLHIENGVSPILDPATKLSNLDGCSGPSGKAVAASKAATATGNITKAVNAATEHHDQSKAIPFLQRLFES